MEASTAVGARVRWEALPRWQCRPRNPVRGLEVAGVVEATGANVTAFKTGDEVFGASEGSFAEYARASQARSPKATRAENP